MSKNGPFQKHHIAVTGDHRCGIFMHDLFTWIVSTKGGLQFDGHEWIAHPRQKWAAKLQFTPDQLRLVLEKLTKKGFIRRCQRRYGDLFPVHVTFTRKYAGELLLCGELGPLEYKKPGAKAGLAHPTGATSPEGDGANSPTLLYKSLKSQKETPTAAFASLTQDGLGQDHESESGMDDRENPITEVDDEPMISASEIVKKFDELAQLRPADSATPAIHVWKAECAKRNFIVSYFTAKEKAQLANIVRSVPAGAGLEFIQRIIRQWADFVYEAEKNHGAFKSPSEPNVAYALRFINAGFNLPEETPPKSVLQAIAAAPKYAPHFVNPEKPAPKKMTMEEFMAIESIEPKKKGAA
jgi:hypothetical protein